MNQKAVQPERIKILNDHKAAEGDYVVYWMQASQRTHYNHALLYAIKQANKLKKPLIVYFGLTDKYPNANQRHYFFMLEGLKEIQESLNEINVQLVVLRVVPKIGAVELAQDASLMVADRGYLNNQIKWREYVAENVKCPMIQIESDVIVPVEVTSAKEEYSAATIRKKIKSKIGDFLVPVKHQIPLEGSLDMNFDSISIQDENKVLSKMKIDRSVKEVEYFRGGTSQAFKHLKNFLKNKLDKFADLRNDPTQDYASHMSPYLHFGQISPLYIALMVSSLDSNGKDAYLEELIVRRELSMNFVFYNQFYHDFQGLPDWAKKTLNKHAEDERDYLYSIDELDRAETHDPYWNAAQQEMVHRGKMHGYMRMYWGKKIIEWVSNPKEAYKIAIFLNDKYELDGRDANGYTGVAWCFGKHDRPWKERNIFGTVRYMNASGLRRKFKIDAYVDLVNDYFVS